MKSKIAKENGITLIALIITIIVLLILAGVSIAMVVGDNGILSQAVNATTATDIADTKEQIEVALVGYLDSNGDYTLADVEQAVADAGATLSGTTVTTAKGNEFDISDIVDGAVVSWSYDDDGNVTNGSVTLAIGDYVDYDPGNYTYTSSSSVNGYADQVFNTSSYSYGWRVLGADEDTGELLIISEDLIGPDSGGYTNSIYNRTYFYLKGQAGYANCESELNAICSIYGNGTGATGARSINVDDINKITGYDPDTAGYGSGAINQYGNVITYFWQGTKYPYYSTSNGLTGSLSTSHNNSSYGNSFYWYDEDEGWQSSAYSSTASTSAMEEITTLTANYYYYYPDTLTTSSSGDTVGISTTSTEYYMLFTNSSTGAYSSGENSTSGFFYWLASPYVLDGTSSACFGCRLVDSGLVMGFNLFYSYGSTYSYYNGVRAAVSLSSDISLSEGSNGVWTIN